MCVGSARARRLTKRTASLTFARMLRMPGGGVRRAAGRDRHLRPIVAREEVVRRRGEHGRVMVVVVVLLDVVELRKIQRGRAARRRVRMVEKKVVGQWRRTS